MKTTRLLAAAAACAAMTAGDVTIHHAPDGAAGLRVGISRAAAVIGRPMTPGSVAGVSRRTTRRTVRRMAALPAGCPLVGAYYYCGGVHYQPVVENGTTVYIVVTP